MAHLSPSAIFSPSVARQQLAAAKDWNYIDGWLTTKFNGRSAPPFERNNDTLKALLALAALNETADEDCDLFAKVDAKALQELQRKEAADDADREILQALEAHLTRDGRASLDALADAGVALNQPFAETERLAQKIVDLHATAFTLEQASDRVAILHGHLTQELAQITALVEELGGDDAYRPSAELPKQTLEHQRKAKVLAAKLPDLRNRVAALTAAEGGSKLTIEDVRVEENRFRESMAAVKELEAQVKSYHGLPHDTDLARLEVEELRVELKKLTRQRDGMFEGLVERESPKRSRP